MSAALDKAVSTLLPEMQRAEKSLRTKAAAIGVTYAPAPFGVLRTLADTTKILGYRDNDYAVYVRALKASNPGKAPIPKEQWRPIAPFGKSYHNYGAAVDLTITGRPNGWTVQRALAELGKIAPTCGLRWGGTFATKNDPPHFELAIPLSEAKRLYDARNKGAVAAAPTAGSTPPKSAVVLFLIAGAALLLLSRIGRA